KPSSGLEPETPPYHEREEGADPCGFAHSGAASRLSAVAASCRVLQGRATLVRPQSPPAGLPSRVAVGAASPFSCRESSANSRRTHPCGLDVFGKTEAAGQRGVGEEGDLVDLAAAQGEHHHAPRLRAQVVAEGRLAVGAGRAEL